MSTHIKQKIWRDVMIELKIGDNYIRERDQISICFAKKTIKSWTPESRKIWLKHIKETCDRAILDWKDRDNKSRTKGQQKRYDKRLNNLRASASKQFHNWRMKHHNKTLSHYLKSTEELNFQLKQWKIVTH